MAFGERKPPYLTFFFIPFLPALLPFFFFFLLLFLVLLDVFPAWNSSKQYTQNVIL